MQISVYTMTVETFLPMLANLSKQLDKAAEFAAAKKFDSRGPGQCAPGAGHVFAHQAGAVDD